MLPNADIISLDACNLCRGNDVRLVCSNELLCGEVLLHRTNGKVGYVFLLTRMHDHIILQRLYEQHLIKTNLHQLVVRLDEEMIDACILSCGILFSDLIIFLRLQCRFKESLECNGLNKIIKSIQFKSFHCKLRISCS